MLLDCCYYMHVMQTVSLAAACFVSAHLEHDERFPSCVTAVPSHAGSCIPLVVLAGADAALLQLVALDIEPYMADFATPFFQRAGLADRIRIVIGPADESMRQLAHQGARWVSLRVALLTADKQTNVVTTKFGQQIAWQQLLLPAPAC